MNVAIPEKSSGATRVGEVAHRSETPVDVARVLANRIWQHHFHSGIVTTPSNFGRLGARPSHPSLLDHLASELVAHGWSIKAMHRLIMRSRAYRRASTPHEQLEANDPDNALFGRFDRRRLTAEELRDALLAVSGRLDEHPGGPHPFPPQNKWGYTQHTPFQAVYDTNKRSVYLMTQRIRKHPFLALFDGPIRIERRPNEGNRSSRVRRCGS